MQDFLSNALNSRLQEEAEQLSRSWQQHDNDFLRHYLVGGVEDPRLNVQSVLTRHFLLEALVGERFQDLSLHELEFAAAMNWLRRFARRSSDPEEWQAVLHALRHSRDNAEGLEIPAFLIRLFGSHPAALASGGRVPNYIEEFLTHARPAQPGTGLPETSLNTFCDLWSSALAGETPRPIRVLEPACGSANDYRFLEAYGLARLIDYYGFDLCEKNVLNARALFPQARFETGNVFQIQAPPGSFDLCFIHDLFEHLSLEGLEAAVREVCRVTRRSLCLGFFRMEDIPDHLVRPVDRYHLNTLSLDRTTGLFAQHGFAARVIHIRSFLRWRVGCPETHNPKAFTLMFTRTASTS